MYVFHEYITCAITNMNFKKNIVISMILYYSIHGAISLQIVKRIHYTL